LNDLIFLRMRFYLLLFVLALGNNAFGQTSQYRFARIDMSKGLSHHTVNDIFRDKNGFVWFATSAGLNRYDGYTIRTFRNVPGDTTSILVDDLSRIFEGPDDKLWIFTHSGNTVYDPKEETFYRNTNVLCSQLHVSPGVIKTIFKDSRGRFWFIHYDQGVFIFDPSTEKTVRLSFTPSVKGSLASNSISAISQDKSGDVWLFHHNGILEKINQRSLNSVEQIKVINELFHGQVSDYDFLIDTDNDMWIFNDENQGCFYFNPGTKRVKNFTTATDVRLSSNLVNKIVQDSRKRIWIATENGGVNIIDKTNFSVTYLFSEAGNPQSLAENTAQAMYKDAEGIIWVGSYKNGVSYYHPDIFRFDAYSSDHGSRPTLPFHDINAFEEDDDGNIWIGTNGGGLIHYDRKKETFRQYLHDPRDASSLSNNVVVSLLIDQEGFLWVGTYYGGLNRFDGKKFIRYKNDPRNPKSLGDDNIWEIFEDSENNLWLGTLKAGVDVFDRRKNEFYHYRPNQLNSIHTTYVPALSEDEHGNVWIGTGYGLEILDKTSGRFTHYLNDPVAATSLSNNSILSIFRDSRGWMWIGSHGGISKFEPSSNSFFTLKESHGLAHNSVLTIAEDVNHNLWMSTPKGISKLVIDKGVDGGYRYSFQNYGESDGLIKGAFHENAVLQCSTGELAFGGYNGFNIFHPQNIKSDTVSPAVVLTDFQALNESVHVGEEIDGQVILSASISTTTDLTLSPDNNFFSIEFASMSLLHPEKTRYRYRLDGFNHDWITTNSDERRATFTNLDPGTYIFRVKATNSDGIWSAKERKLRIVVLPPFWKTNIAYFLYAALVVAGLLFARTLIVARERLKFKVHNERAAAQRMHEVDMMKIKFFTNVSHEFRTPLTLILTPLEKLLGLKRSTDEEKQLQMIYRNARRLLNLVNQLLDFRRMEIEELKLSPSEGDLVQFIRDLVVSFSDLSEKKNIQLKFVTAVDKLESVFDPDKLEKVLFNLLSNAFKFTPENGKVTVELSVVYDPSSALIIRVQDTGIGIPKEMHQKIFERFFQNHIPDTLVNQGSGIGLSIASEFVKLHGGSIEAQSEPGTGSTFIVRIPVVATDATSSVRKTQLDAEEVRADAQVVHELAQTAQDQTKPVVLLIDDNEDFLFYLKDNLKALYNIVEAQNGKQGLEKATSLMPDLIVSDVMMPGINGIELCKQVKSNSATSHIPLILLTARSSQEQKIEGYEAGANDYITKPFSFQILESRIKNLLAVRALGHQQFQKHFDIRVSEIQVASADEKLVNDAVKLVEENLANSDFSVEEMSRMLAMSRVQLYKKLHSLTGKTPIEFIRFIRIQRAAQLLRKSKYTVSEIAYQVGFNNPKYFAKYFKEEFNMLPSAYAGQARENKTKEPE
jgi:signal transduction histidine kinase/ligand-binding sensor domain-containing protein/DNA-binding response OmpR family regulator